MFHGGIGVHCWFGFIVQLVTNEYHQDVCATVIGSTIDIIIRRRYDCFIQANRNCCMPNGRCLYEEWKVYIFIYRCEIFAHACA